MPATGRFGVAAAGWQRHKLRFVPNNGELHRQSPSDRIKAAPTALVAAAILSPAAVQQDGAIGGSVIAVFIAVRSHDVRMPASRAVVFDTLN
jgi:hypothetical protein